MKEEAYKFLSEHKGYLKKSPKVVQERLYKLGINVSISDIKEIKFNIKNEYFTQAETLELAKKSNINLKEYQKTIIENTQFFNDEIKELNDFPIYNAEDLISKGAMQIVENSKIRAYQKNFSEDSKEFKDCQKVIDGNCKLEDLPPICNQKEDVPKVPDNMKLVRTHITANGKQGFSYALDKTEVQDNDVIESLQKIIEDGVTPFGVRASRSKNDKMISIFSSDKHIGAMTARNSIYSNDYDRDEIFIRHEKLVDNILDEHDTFGQFKKLVFYDLGDALDGNNGQTTRGGHNLPQNMDSREQIDTFIEVTIKTMETLINADIAEEIWFIATTNCNHSGSFGHGAVRAIQMYLQAKYPQIKTLVTAKMLEHITFGEHTYIFGHGKDDSDMKFGMPVVLNDKTEGFINDYIDRKKIRSKYIHVVTGDLHQSAETFAKRFRYKKVMSMYGSSKWIHTNFGSGEAGVDYEVSELNSPKVYKTRMTYGHDS